MQVRCDEGIATHIGPESCAVHREVHREALTGDGIGQPSSRESLHIPGADAVDMAEGNTFKGATASTWTTRRGRRTWHVHTLLAREPGDLGFDQPLYWAGPHREGEEP